VFKFIIGILICVNFSGRNWDVVDPGSHTRLPNGILGLLCKLHWPGLVEVDGQEVAATSFDHYALKPDQADRDGRIFQNKGQRVVAEFWVSIPRITLHCSIHRRDWIWFTLSTFLYAGFFQVSGGIPEHVAWRGYGRLPEACAGYVLRGAHLAVHLLQGHIRESESEEKSVPKPATHERTVLDGKYNTLLFVNSTQFDRLFRVCTWSRVGASVVGEWSRSSLGNDRRHVVCAGLGGCPRWAQGATFEDAWSSAPSRQPKPACVCT